MGLKAVANLGGGGGGSVGGSGTPGKIAKFTGATTLGDSLLSESGTTITSAATAQTFSAAQTWTVPSNAYAITVGVASAPALALALDSNNRHLGVGTVTGPGTILHASDGVAAFAGSTYEGVRLQRATEALFSASDTTLSFRAGLTGATAVVGTSTAHDLLLQRGNVTAATLQSGAIATLTLTAGGTGYANGTYSQQVLTGGAGTGATADIVVAGGIATAISLRSPGTGYAAADALSCATIGAGAGFIATAATIAQVVAAAGNLTALGRIGAGTATPRAALDVVGGVWVNGFEPANAPNAYSQSTGILSFLRSFATIRAGVQTFDASVTGTSSINSVSATPILTNLSGNYSYQGIQISPLILSSSGTGFVTGCSFRHLRTTSGDLATPTVTGSLVNFLAFTGAASAASYNYSTINGFQFASNLNAAGTTVDLAAFNASPITLNSGHVVTTAYGLRLQAATISGGASITTRFGISQEDPLATNQFLAVTNTFSGVVRATGSSATLPAFSTPADTNTGLYFPSADTVRIGTNGSPGLEIDSAQNLKFNSGYGSVATAYGCRAWVNFNGATVAIRGSGGISSVTRSGAGSYVTNFSTTMPDTGYAAIATKQSVASNTDCQIYDLVASRTTTSALWVNVESAAVVDSANINIAFFR